MSDTNGARAASRVNVAVFVSGTGSNLQALLDTSRQEPSYPAEVALVVSDKPGCRALERAALRGIPTFAARPSDFADKAAFETAILEQLRLHGARWIVLAGYMKLIGPVLLNEFPNRIINIHPSLLPLFPGKHAVKDALAADVLETGVTVHYVDAGMDTGRMIAQRKVQIDAGMTEEELLERIHAVEHKLYPEVVRALCEQHRGEVRVEA